MEMTVLQSVTIQGECHYSLTPMQVSRLNLSQRDSISVGYFYFPVEIFNAVALQWRYGAVEHPF